MKMKGKTYMQSWVAGVSLTHLAQHSAIHPGRADRPGRPIDSLNVPTSIFPSDDPEDRPYRIIQDSLFQPR